MTIIPILALAGIAEAALGLQINVAVVTLCLLPVLLVWTMASKSRAVGILGLVVTLGIGLLCEPWHLFMQREFADPDMTYWASRLRTVSMWWISAVCVGVPAFILVLRRNWDLGTMENQTPNNTVDSYR